MSVFAIIFIVMSAMSGGIELSKHGKQKEGKHNFAVWLMSAIITFTLLYFGGFFK